MYMPVPTQRLMIFPDSMAPSLRVKCLVVGFGGSPAPRWLVAGARACANISPFIPHEPLIQQLFGDFQDAIHEPVRIPFVTMEVI